MKKINLIIITIVFTCLLFLFFDKSYDLKIEIKIKNSDAKNNDENYSKNIEEDISKISQIKDFIIFSSNKGINIYCKLKLFTNKSNIIQSIQLKIAKYNFKEIEIIEKYNSKYHFFIILKSDGDYYSLIKQSNHLKEQILKLKISNDVRTFGIQNLALNLYFSPDLFLKYDITLEEIKNIIKNNNLKNNLILNKNYLSFDSFYSSEKDIENLLFKFKNSNFSIPFNDIFKIEKDIEKPKEYSIFYNDFESIILAISKKPYYPLFLIKFLLKDLNIEIIEPNKLKKIEFYLPKNLNHSSLEKFIKKFQKENSSYNNLYFLGLEAPKIKNEENFEEIINNRIIVFTTNKKLNDDSGEIQITPYEILGINYKIDNYKLNEYNLDKKEILDSFLLDNKGIFCDYYFDSQSKINIYLKNQNKSNFIYSKKLKTLIDRDLLLRSELKNQTLLIARKNFKEIKLIKPKNPSIIRRVKFQIR